MKHTPSSSSFRRLFPAAMIGSALGLSAACGGEGTVGPEGVVDGDEPSTPDEPASTPAFRPPGEATGPGLAPPTECGPDQTACGGVCVDPMVDPQHCGTCDHGCVTSECRDGICALDGWASLLDGDYLAVPAAAVTTTEGDTLVVGAFEGRLDHADPTPDSKGQRDVFVARLDPAGQLKWLRRFGGADDERATAVAVDAEGRIFLAGDFDGELVLDAEVLRSAGGDDIFVAMLAPDGTVEGAQAFGDAPDEAGQVGPVYAQRATALAVDARGALLLAGTFGGALALGDRVIEATAGEDAFIVDLGDGSLLSKSSPRWIRPLGGMGDQVVRDVVATDDGEVLAAGGFDVQLKLGTIDLLTAGDRDGFVLSLGSEGEVVWARAHGDQGPEEAVALAVDEGTVFVAGNATTPYVLALGAEGAIQGGVAIDGASAVLTDLAAGGGRVWAAGRFDGSIDVGIGTLTSADTDAFVLLFDGGLQPQWGHRYGGLGFDTIAAVTLAGSDATIVGSVATSLSDNLAPSQPGPSHLFVSRLEP